MRIPVLLSIGAVLLPVWACHGSGSSPPAEASISRETFVQAYYLLRMEGIRSPDMEITPRARDRILNDLEITEGDLLAFVESWGTDGELMEGIWGEVDSLMREERTAGYDEAPVEGQEPVRQPVDPRGRGVR